MLTFDSLRSVFKTQSNQSKFQSTILFPAIFWGLPPCTPNYSPPLHWLRRPLLGLYQRQHLWNHIQTLCIMHFSRVIACIPFYPALCMVHFSGVLACIPADPALCKIHFCRASVCIPAELLPLPLLSGAWGDCRRHSQLLAVPESIKMLHHQCRMVRIYHQSLEHRKCSYGLPSQVSWDSGKHLAHFFMGVTHHQEWQLDLEYILHEFKNIKTGQFVHLW